LLQNGSEGFGVVRDFDLGKQIRKKKTISESKPFEAVLY
jgi:hypothetical protein